MSAHGDPLPFRLIFKLQRPTSYRRWQKDGTSSGRDLNNRFSAEQEIDRLKTLGRNECPTVCGKLLQTTPLTVWNPKKTFKSGWRIQRVTRQLKSGRGSVRGVDFAMDRCSCWAQEESVLGRTCAGQMCLLRVWTRRTAASGWGNNNVSTILAKRDRKSHAAIMDLLQTQAHTPSSSDSQHWKVSSFTPDLLS